jgi:hypothetical protein
MGKTETGTRKRTGESDSGPKREDIRRRRDELFRSGWKNQRKLMPLVSREEDNAFRFLVEWCEEFDDVLFHHRERLSDPTPRIRQR